MNLSDEVKDIWNTNAEMWNKRMGEGNIFHKTLIEPTQLNLLEVKPKQKILDISCGNGQFSRKLFSLGSEVTAIDISEKFIELAKNNTYGNDINYQVIDVTRVDDLEKLSKHQFDSAVCGMAFMDIEDIDPIFKILKKILKKDGKFVFSLSHPCFNSGQFKKVREEEEIDSEIYDKYWISVTDYSKSKTYKGLGMTGQPKPQYYFHRTISEILKIGFANGFVLNGFEEPNFSKIDTGNNFFLKTYENIPAALVCRFIHQ